MKAVVPIELQPPAVQPDQLPALVYLATLRPSGRKSIGRGLELMARLASGGQLDAMTFPWWKLRYQHTTVIRTALIDRGYAPATVNHHLAALRSVLRHCWLLELMTAEDFHRAIVLPSVKASVLPAGRDVAAGEIHALVAACQGDPRAQGIRDGALLGVAFTAGLRVQEIVHLDLEDYRDGELTVRFGKGSKQRLTYLASGAKRAVEGWVESRGTEPGPLFVAINKGGKISAARLTDSAVKKMLLRRAQQAGVQRLSPHDCRRTWIGNLYSSGVDASIIQRLAGHSSASTTSKYDRRPEEAKRDAVQRLSFPWLEVAHERDQSELERLERLHRGHQLTFGQRQRMKQLQAELPEAA